MTDQVIQILDHLTSDYQIIECDPQLADTAQFCERYGYELDESANAILVVGKGEPRRYALCVVLATTQVDVNKVVRKKLGVKKASFATPEETETITGMVLGGVTPFGLPETLSIWIDGRALQRSKVIVGGGARDRKIYVTPQALTALPSSEVIDDLAKERPPT